MWLADFIDLLVSLSHHRPTLHPCPPPPPPDTRTQAKQRSHQLRRIPPFFATLCARPATCARSLFRPTLAPSSNVSSRPRFSVHEVARPCSSLVSRRPCSRLLTFLSPYVVTRPSSETARLPKEDPLPPLCRLCPPFPASDLTALALVSTLLQASICLSTASRLSPCALFLTPAPHLPERYPSPSPNPDAVLTLPSINHTLPRDTY